MPRFGTSTRQDFAEHTDEFDQIEGEAGEWVRRFDDAKEAVTRGFARAEEKRQNNVELLVAMRAVGLAGRIRQLLDAVVTLVNKRNPHAAAPVARALFEACCVPIYLQRELVPRLEKGRTNAAHQIVFKLGLGGIVPFSEDVTIKPIKVDALISSARAELKEMEAGLPEDERTNVEQLIEIYYGPLTDLTHPNFMALNLGTEIDFPPKFEYPAPFDDYILNSVVASSAYALWTGGRAFDRTLEALRDSPLDLPIGVPDWPDAGKATGL